MAVALKFDLRQLDDLSTDLRGSVKALPVIVQRVLTLQLRELRNQMRPMVPRGSTGRLQRSFGSSVRRVRGTVVATFGFLTARQSANAVIAGNVLQHGGATARKGEYLWIPLGANKNITPKDFFGADNTFIFTSGAGNRIAALRHGTTIIPLFVLRKTVRMRTQPLPIEQRVTAKLPEINADIETTVAEVIAARRAAIGVAGG